MEGLWFPGARTPFDAARAFVDGDLISGFRTADGSSVALCDVGECRQQATCTLAVDISGEFHDMEVPAQGFTNSQRPSVDVFVAW